MDKKSETMEKREAGLAAREEALNKRNSEVESLYEKGIQELEKISGLTSEQAKEYLLKSVEDDVKHDTAKLIKNWKTKQKKKLIKKQKNMWLLPFKDVQRTMWQRQPFLLFSFPMMR